MDQATKQRLAKMEARIDALESHMVTAPDKAITVTAPASTVAKKPSE